MNLIEMVASCVYCGAEGMKGRTYHKFPLKEDSVLQSWLQNMGLGSNFVPNKHSLLCSDHFEKNLFRVGMNIKCLRSGSIPTLFGAYKSLCVYCRVRKGQDKTRSFRKFPLDRPELLKKWVDAMELKDFMPNEKSWLCSDHFEKKCFRSSGRGLILRAHAVPTLFSSIESEGIPVQLRCNSPEKVDNGSSEQAMSLLPNFMSGEYCNKNIVPTTNAAEKVNSPIGCRTPETLSVIKRRIFLTMHDHQYEISPQLMRKRFIRQQNKMKVLMKQVHVQKQHISRLKKKVTSLKETVNDLRKTQAVPDSGS